ncbi:IclR family transcriptional regulator C-terminal domain-containing protein [Streptomyces sp. TLI_146]|uniref:IclR family transcriptional regulator domain-containing protein n=1 Tax=Streptomyces sp. TLI_146 TaxID=1938858 RepID=UPI000C711A00|nr:IclR family transcriptional regulator C-terminal domain-containing protein [Streptomyces sp. TLI_146]
MSVGPLERGLAVLRALAAYDPDRGTDRGTLVRATGLPRATVDRVVATLDRLGLVRVDGRDVALAPRLMTLSGAYLRGSGIPAALGPLVGRLADELDESVSVGVPDGDGVRVVLRTAARRRTMSLAFRVGDLLPADRCAPGALFADGALEWALDEELIEPGLIAVAVPVRDGAGATVCAVSVASHTSRHSPRSLREAVLPRLREAGGAMEAALAERTVVDGADPVAGADPMQGAAFVDASGALKRELGPDFLQSLARGLAVLCALGADRGEGLTLTAVSETTGLARATVRRSLLTLVELGYVERGGPEGHRFRLLPRVLELGCARLSALGPAEVARPHLARLVARTGESASMAVLDGADIRYVARVPTVRIMSIDITVGTRFPAYATSMGRVLLAALAPGERPPLPDGLPALTPNTVTSAAGLTRIVERCAADGYALVAEELEVGLRSLAVPVRGAGGRVVAAVNVAQHAGRGRPEEMLRTLLPELRAAAAGISADLAVLGVSGAPGHSSGAMSAVRP